MSNSPKYSAAILAGGKSSRLGRPKALSEFRGKALIQWVIDVLRPHSDELIIIGSDPGLKALGYPLFADSYQNTGPLAGIREALLHCQNEQCFVMACDMPFLSGRLIDLLKMHPEADALVPRHDEHIEPLAARYSRKALAVIESQILAGEFKLQNAIEKMNYHYLQLEDYEELPGHLFVNLNTLREWKKWQ